MQYVGGEGKGVLNCGNGWGRVGGMVEIMDIVDRKSLEAWLEGRPNYFSGFIANRASLRVLPINWKRDIFSGKIESGGDVILPLLVNNFQSHIALRYPRSASVTEDSLLHEFRYQLQNSVAFAASDAQHTLTLRRKKPIVAASSAAVKHAEKACPQNANIWKEIRLDCLVLYSGYKLIYAPLWQNQPNPFKRDWTELERYLNVIRMNGCSGPVGTPQS